MKEEITIREFIKLLMDFDMDGHIIIEDSNGGSSHFLTEDDLIPIQRDSTETLLLTKQKENKWGELKWLKERGNIGLI